MLSTEPPSSPSCLPAPVQTPAAEPAATFDHLVLMATLLLDAPIAFIVLSGEGGPEIKASCGLDLVRAGEANSLAALLPVTATVTVIKDIAQDARLAGRPLVASQPHLRFAAGAPLYCREDVVGTLVIADTTARDDFGADESRRLAQIAATVSSVVVLHHDAAVNLALLKNQAETQKKLEMMEDVAGVGYWHLDIAGSKIFWSKGVYTIHGVDRETYHPELGSAIDWYHPDDRAQVSHAINHAIATGEESEFELRIIRADGEERRVYSRGSIGRAADGQAESVFGVFTDMTERRAAQRRLEDSEAQLRLLADNVPGMVGYWDAGLRCRFANHLYEKWFGRAPEDIIGAAMAELMEPAFFADNEPFARRALTGERQAFERARANPQGEVGYFWVQYIPDSDADGHVRGFYVLATDVTALKVKELALVTSNPLLQEARCLAEAAAEAKSRFLATISHEIRTPLTAILGYADLLVGSAHLTVEDSGFVKRIGKAGRSLLGLVNDVLDMSRLDTGQVVLDPVATQVCDCIEAVVGGFHDAARANGSVLSFTAAGDLPAWLMVDAQRLSQIAAILVGNACKFTPGGRIDVTLARITDAFGEHLRLEVADNGIGMAPDALAGIFQRFHQVDDGISRKHGGSGLGLAICSEVVNLMGGRIGVDSTAGAGSRFWTELPLVRAQIPGHPDTNPYSGRLIA